MSRRDQSFRAVKVVVKKLEEKGVVFKKEKPVILEVKNFFLSEESKPAGKWERIRDWLPIIDLINKLISFF
jgi:hypothetical protein